MHKYFIIALMGHQGSGKDKVAELIFQQYSARTQILSFSEPIKKIAKDIFGIENINKNTSYVDTIQRGTNMTKRRLYQGIGTGFRHYLYSEIFIDLWVKEQKKILMVIPDLRFSNELNFVKNNPNCVIRVERKEVSPINLEHESEQEWPTFSYNAIIQNDGTVDLLYENVRNTILPLIPSWVLEPNYDGFYKLWEKDIQGFDNPKFYIDCGQN